MKLDYQSNTGGAIIDENIMPATSDVVLNPVDSLGKPMSIVRVGYKGVLPEDGLPPQIGISNGNATAAYLHASLGDMNEAARHRAEAKADAAERQVRRLEKQFIDLCDKPAVVYADHIMVRFAAWIADRADCFISMLLNCRGAYK